MAKITSGLLNNTLSFSDADRKSDTERAARCTTATAQRHGESLELKAIYCIDKRSHFYDRVCV